MTPTAALLLWGVLILFFVVIEATSVKLVSLWFAVGALAALIGCACGLVIWVQVALFVAVSIAVLFAMRPLAKKFKEKSKEKFNESRTVGRHGIVTVEINNAENSGMIRVGSTLWTARASAGSEIFPVGMRVTVEKIDGVRAMVRKSHHQPGTKSVSK